MDELTWQLGRAKQTRLTRLNQLYLLASVQLEANYALKLR